MSRPSLLINSSAWMFMEKIMRHWATLSSTRSQPDSWQTLPWLLSNLPIGEEKHILQWGGWGAASTLQYSWPYLLLSWYLKQTQRHRQCSYLVHLEVRWRLVSAIEKSNISHQHRPQLILNLFNHYIKKKITVTVKVVPCWTPMRCSFSWFPWRNVSSEMQHIKATLFS